MLIRLWDARSGAAIGEPLAGHTNWVTAVALGEVDGGAVVVSGSHDATIRLWDARAERARFSIKPGFSVTSTIVDADAGIVAGCAAGLLCLEFAWASP